MSPFFITYNLSALTVTKFTLFSFQSFQCLCQPGYIGKYCETDIDDCAPTPCQHSGVCTDLVDNYTCDCAGTGFMGDQCQINIDECQMSPCLHGRCNDTIGDYTCTCDATFCGKNCSRQNPCLSDVSFVTILNFFY